jgi:hypothetical protein
MHGSHLGAEASLNVIWWAIGKEDLSSYFCRRVSHPPRPIRQTVAPCYFGID